MKRRTLQIDVKGPLDVNMQIMACNLYVDGRCCKIFMSKIDYENLRREDIFVRDGNTKDSADILNTTRVFEERV
ncbi:hypothetical protein D3C87_1635500 [compost metagenome]